MICLLTAFKRTLRNRLFWAMLALLVGCVLFFGSIEHRLTAPQAGIVLCDEDAAAVSLRDALAAEGVTVYPDEEAMRLAIRNGDIAAGFAVGRGLTERLASGQIGQCTRVYCMPTASFVEASMLRVSAHLCDLYAPYLVERLSAEHGVTLSAQQVRAHIDGLLQSDAAFEFCFEDMQGAALQGRSYAQGLIYGIFAVLLFCLFVLCSATEKDASLQTVRGRIGGRRAFDTVFLPALAVRFALCAAAVGAAGLLCHTLYGTQVHRLWWQCGLYMLFLCGIGAAADALLGRFGRIQIAVMTLALLSLGVCPIFVDVSAFIGIPEAVKCLLPPYFFYKVMGAPALCAAVAVAVCGGGLWLRRQTM